MDPERQVRYTTMCMPKIPERPISSFTWSARTLLLCARFQVGVMAAGQTKISDSNLPENVDCLFISFKIILANF